MSSFRGRRFIVLSSRDHASYQKVFLPLQQVLESFIYLKPETAQEKGETPSAKQDAPKVIETDDMKLAMKARELETAGKYDEALKLYAEAIDLKGRFTPFVYHNRGMLYFTGQRPRKINNRELPTCKAPSLTFRVPLGSERLPTKS